MCKFIQFSSGASDISSNSRSHTSKFALGPLLAGLVRKEALFGLGIAAAVGGRYAAAFDRVDAGTEFAGAVCSWHSVEGETGGVKSERRTKSSGDEFNSIDTSANSE